MENEIINQFNERNEVVFSKLFTVLYPQLFKYAKCLIKDHHDSEDIVLVVLHKLFSCNNRFNSYEELKYFSVAITKHECINYLKSPKSKRNSNINDIEIIDAQESKPELDFNIYSAISKIPQNYQDIINLFIMGYKTSEISQILNINQALTRKRKQLAILSIKSTLNK